MMGSAIGASPVRDERKRPSRLTAVPILLSSLTGLMLLRRTLPADKSARYFPSPSGLDRNRYPVENSEES